MPTVTKPLRILLYNDVAQIVGGTEVYLQKLEKALLDRGHLVKRISLLEKERLYGSKWSFRFFRYAYFRSKKIQRKVEREITLFKPDIIHLHNNWHFTPSVLQAIKSAGVPAVQTIHDMYQYAPVYVENYWDDHKRSKWIHKIKSLKFRLIERRIQHFISLSTYIHSLIRKGYARDKVSHTPFFLDREHWPWKAGRNYETPRILYIGRIEDYKGVFTLFEAFQKVKLSTHSCELYYVGYGTKLESLQKLASPPGSAVHVLGLQSHEEIVSQLHQATVCVVPSAWPEPFGIVGLEAQATGCPVIASNIGGIPEWCVDGETGLLFEPENPEMLAQKINSLLTDPELAKRIAVNAKERLDSYFNRKQHLEKLEKIYAQYVRQT